MSEDFNPTSNLNLKRDLDAPQAELDEDMRNQATLIARYSFELAKANRTAKRVKLELTVYEASLYASIRDKAAARGEKLTEAQITARMHRDDEWLRRSMLLIDKEAEAEQIKGVVDGIRQKKDMLVQLSSNSRQERAFSGQMMESGVNAEQRGERTNGYIPILPKASA